jgi:hypothetical protein
MDLADEPDVRSIAVEAVITSVLRRFYRLDQTVQMMFDQALEDAARSIEALAQERPKWRGELNESLSIIDQIQFNMKKPLNLPLD